METGMGSSIVTFKKTNSSTDLTKKKVWDLILSKGSEYDAKIDIKLFENSVLSILNKELYQTTTSMVHLNSGWLCMFSFVCFVFVDDDEKFHSLQI